MKEVRVGAVARPTSDWWATTMDGKEKELFVEDKLIVVALKRRSDEELVNDIYDLILPGLRLIELDSTEFEVREEDQPEILTVDWVDPSEVKFGDRVTDARGWEFVVDTMKKDLDTGRITFKGTEVDTGERCALRSGDMPVHRTVVTRMSPWV